MSRTGLIGQRVSQDEVYAVPKVERTVTWNPVHHRDLDEALRGALKAWDFEVVEAEYSLSQNGMRFFAAYILYSDDFSVEGKTITLGARNAMDKSMSVGICAGRYVTVCTNMAFHGDFVEFRRHTGKFSIEELRHISHRGVQQVGSQMQEFGQWLNGLENYNISRSSAEALAFRAIEQGILPPSKVNKFIDIYFQKGGMDIYSDTLGGFHGTMTEIQSRNSLIGQGQWNKKLNTLMDNAVVEIKDYQMIIN